MSSSKIKIEIIDANDFEFFFSVCKPDSNLNWGCEKFIVDILELAGGKDCQKSILGDDEKTRTRIHYPMWVVAHPISDFIGGQRAKASNEIPFSQDLLLSVNEQLPILHIATTDLYAPSLYNSDVNLNSLVPRSFQIMDSSIWNYLVTPFDIDVFKKVYKDNGLFEVVLDYTIEWKKALRCAIHSIFTNYHEKKLYSLTIAHEYADLNARLLNQSYLSGAHAKGVSPFIFHSEDVISRLIVKEFEERNTINEIKRKKWRILLVDDKAISEMDNQKFPKENENYGNSPIMEEDDSNLPWNCKLAIIIKLLKKVFGVSEIPYRRYDGKENGKEREVNQDAILLIEYAESLHDAVAALKIKKYDLILLDYLLAGKHNNYGYQLLDKIVSDYESQRKRSEKKYIFKYGPRKRFFFMFISAYSSAVYERLLAEGLNQSEDYWFVSVGACPTNTPQLFLYNLIKMMEKRMDDSGILKLSSVDIFELVDKIFLPKKDDQRGDSVRKRANAFYQKVLSLQYHYRSILKDVEIPFGQYASVFDTKGSVLMTDFIQKKINLGGLLEHLTQLVHLTAFGTVRQWPEMWEEYVYFKAMFERQLDDVGERSFRNLCGNIEDYILKLKSQQQ